MAGTVAMPKEDWVAALNATREKLGTTDLILSNQLAGLIQSIGGGESTFNCEAYLIDVTRPNAIFKTSTGTLKAWGYGENGSGYQTTKYAFEGTKYAKISFQSTETQLNLTVDASGNITGLPQMTKGTILITKGI